VQLVDRSVEPVLLLYLGERGFSVTTATRLAGVLFSILALSGAAGNQLADRLLRRWSPRAVIAGTTVGAAAALVGFSAVSNPWLLAVAIAAVGTGLGVAATVSFTTAGSAIPLAAHGASFGFLTGASLVGSAAGSAAAGLVAAQSMRVVFLTGAAVLAVLACAVARAMRTAAGGPLEDAPGEAGPR
jgi:MFS family permease